MPFSQLDSAQHEMGWIDDIEFAGHAWWPPKQATSRSRESLTRVYCRLKTRLLPLAVADQPVWQLPLPSTGPCSLSRSPAIHSAIAPFPIIRILSPQISE